MEITFHVDNSRTTQHSTSVTLTLFILRKIEPKTSEVMLMLQKLHFSLLLPNTNRKVVYF